MTKAEKIKRMIRRVRARAYYKLNIEKMRQYAREYYKSHLEERRAYYREYFKQPKRKAYIVKKNREYKKKKKI